MNVWDIIKMIFGQLVLGIVLIFVYALIAGSFLYWGNDFALIRPIYEHFGIAGLTYNNYVFGSWIFGVIFKLMFQTKVDMKVKK